MHRLIGKGKKKEDAPTLDEATRTTDARAAHLDQKIAKLDAELARYKAQLKGKSGSAASAIKQRAMRVLKQKRMYEGQRDTLAQQSFNMDQSKFAMESLQSTASTVSAMKAANKTLKKQFKNVDIDEIENMQDDMSDMLEQADEIQAALGRSYDVGEDLDEADLEAELDMLAEEDLGAELSATPSYLGPSVADSELGTEQVDEFGLPSKQKVAS